ncbi:MAG: hypothetical protein Q7O12_01140 [Deltaproteobacteria bacterium]|nr:hypothetical protein [Deltaproteobacteria bacterium]
MQPITIISLFKNELVGLKKQGIEQLSIDGLIDYLSQLEVTRENLSSITPAELEHYKAQLAMWVDSQKSQSQISAEGFKSVILAGQNALRSSLLINGGAAIALLAYIGKLKIEASNQISALALPLLIFVIGVLVAAINSGLTYLSQWFYFGGAIWKRKVGFVINIINILLGIASYGLFAIGIFFAYKFFAH